MDKFRNPNPGGEGYSRLGRGGEIAGDDNTVEGHSMSLNKPDDEGDVEGHRKLRVDESDVEGHRKLRVDPGDESDVEGHRKLRGKDDDESDTEGHRKLRIDESDTEGHASKLR